MVVLAGHLLVASAAGGPVAVPDVPAYLSFSQWAASGGLVPQDLPFQPGYGLLVAPLVAVAQVATLPTQGDSVHYLALLVNSIAATGAAAAAGRLGWLVSRNWWVTVAGASVAVVHPSLSSASRIAWPEALLGLAVLAVAIAIAIAASTERASARTRSWALAGLLATLTVALHARGVVLIGAVAAAALVVRIGRRGWAWLGAGSAVGAMIASAALTMTDTWPMARLSEAVEFDRGWQPVATVSGQLLALGAGTVGLGLIALAAGVVVSVAQLRRRRAINGSNPTLDAVAVFVAAGALAVVVLGGWTLTGSARADTLLYGRYVDPWAVPLAVTALAWLVARHPDRRRQTSTVASAVVAVAACVAVLAAPGSFDAAPRRIMTLSFSPAWSWFDGGLTAVVIAAVVVTVAGVGLAAAVLRSSRDDGGGFPDDDADDLTSDVTRVRLQRVRRRAQRGVHVPAIGTLVVAVLALGTVATISNHRYLADVGAVARGQVTASGAVADAVADEGVTCLAHDRTSVPSYALWLYRMELPAIDHERVSIMTGATPCSEFVIAHDDLGKHCTNAQHLVGEPAGAWALWRLAGAECAGAAV